MTPHRTELAAELDMDLAKHASFGEKFTGGPGELETANWVVEELEAAGYDVTRQTVNLPRFDSFEVSLSPSIPALRLLAQPVVAPTGPEGLVAPICVIHDAVEAPRSRGRIAVVVIPYGRHSTIWLSPVAGMLHAAAEAGAVAVVALVSGPSGDIVALNTPAEAPFLSIPVVVGCPEDLPRFLALQEAGTSCRLVVDGETRDVPSPNIIATRGTGTRWIAISTPRTGFFTCATERGSGTAAFLAMARRLPREYPDHSVFLINTTGHELHFAGTHEALQHAPPPDRTDIWVHLGATLAAYDMQEMRNSRLIGGVDPNRISMATPDSLEAVRTAFAGMPGLDSPREVLPGAGELSSIVDLGYRNAFAVLGQSR